MGRKIVYRRIVVPLDGSELAECVLPHVEAIARGCNASKVLLITVVEPITIPYGRQVSKIASIEQLKAFETRHRMEAEKYLKKVEERLKKVGIDAQSFVVNGKAAEAIAEFAVSKKADLVAIATHGRSGVSRLVWGSVADHVIRSINMPVLLIRSPGCTL